MENNLTLNWWQTTVFKHIMAWFGYLLYCIFLVYLRIPDFDLIDLLLQHTIMIGVFYANVYLVYENLFRNKKYFKGAYWFILVVVGYCFVRYIVVFYIIPVVGVGAGKFPYLNQSYIASTIAFYVNFALYSGIYFLVQNLIYKEYMLRIAERERMEAERARIKADYAFLKAQVSPHFMHNTLNFLYAKMLPYSTQLSDSILVLSDILRYALLEDASVEGKTSLGKELEHIRNVIKINQLRFNDRLHIVFKVEGATEGLSIVPFVLITLVENAIKYGDLLDPAHPVNIHLKIDETQHQFSFAVHNKKRGGPIELSTGIGLNNLRKRMDWVYGNEYTFTTHEDDMFYDAKIELTL